MNLLVSDGLISLHVQKEGAEHITKCITMKRNIKRPAPPPPVSKKEVQIENDDDDYAQVICVFRFSKTLCPILDHEDTNITVICRFIGTFQKL